MNFFSSETRRDPYPYYRELRRTARLIQAEGFGWLVSRREDVLSVLCRPDLFSSAVMAKADVALLGNDPPSHTAVRRIANRLFASEPAFVSEAFQRAIAETLLTRLPTQWDFVADFAAPFPLLVIAHALGIEPDRWPEMKRWSEAVVSAATGLSPRSASTADDLAAFDADFLDRIDRRSESPGTDLISALLREPLSGAQILSLAKILLTAGGETTTNLIGNAVLALLRNPAELARVIADPSLIPAAVEETLRYDPPVQFVIRVTSASVSLAGATLPTGARVIALLASANRDENFYSDPERFHIDRTPRPHAAFGAGIHHCLGVNLARIEAKVALTLLVPLLASHPPKQDLNEVPLVDSLQMRGPKRLPHGPPEPCST